MKILHHRKRLVIAGGIVVLVVGIVAFLYYRHNPYRAQVEQLRTQLANQSLRPEQRRALWQTAQQLPRDQRRVLYEDQRKNFEERIKQYFKLSKKEQIAFLDKEINRMVAMRNPAPRGPGPGGAGRGPGPHGPGKGRSSTPEQREHWRKARLDRSTPEQRALRSEYFKQLNQRRQQRGLAAIGPPRGGR